MFRLKWVVHGLPKIQRSRGHRRMLSSVELAHIQSPLFSKRQVDGPRFGRLVPSESRNIRESSICIEVAIGNSRNQASLEDPMKYFGLEHPPDRLILCNRSGCADIADYQEVSEQGREDFACAAHTSSERHASVLPKGVSSVKQQRSRPAG